MSTISEALAAALGCHQRGELSQAEQICRRIVQIEPHHADAWHMLGVAASHTGRHAEAVEAFSRAITVNGTNPNYHLQLGTAYAHLQQYELAETSFRRALALDRADPRVLYNLAALLNIQGQRAAAIENYRRAAQLDPQFFEAQFNLGELLRDSGQWLAAEECFASALALRPDHVPAILSLAAVQAQQNKLELAEANWRRALHLDARSGEANLRLGSLWESQGKHRAAIEALRIATIQFPRNSEAHNNLGCACHALGQLHSAAQSFRQSLALNPDSPQGHYNLAAVLYDLGRLDDAVASYERSLALQANPMTDNNLGNLYYEQGQLEKSLSHLQRAIAAEPELASARYNRAMVWLAQGRLSEGWQEYEWRWRLPQFTLRHPGHPLWNGEPLAANQTLLVHTEQGFGDTIQFIRYLPLVRERCANVVVEVQPRLIPLFEQSGISGLVPRGAPLPDFDVQCSLGGLPRILDTTLETIPAPSAYLKAQEELVDQWRTKLAQHRGFRVGVAWQGSPTYRGDCYRSVPLAEFAPLAEVETVQLFSLQKGPGSEQIAQHGSSLGIIDFGGHIDEQSGPFMDTAALMQNLDLVISSDTSLAHLAGALGVPVWVALRVGPDWRWLEHRSDSPWYPSMRLFRQRHIGVWRDVFADMARELARLV